MKIELQPQIEKLLTAQVDAGLFDSVEEAVAAAVMAAYEKDDRAIDLSWAQPFLEQAERNIASGCTHSHDQVWERLGRRTGGTSRV